MRVTGFSTLISKIKNQYLKVCLFFHNNFKRKALTVSVLLFFLIMVGCTVVYFTYYKHASLFGGVVLGYCVWLLAIYNLYLGACVTQVTMNYFIFILFFMSRILLYYLAGIMAYYIPIAFNFMTLYVTLILMYFIFYFNSWFLNFILVNPEPIVFGKQ